MNEQNIRSGAHSTNVQAGVVHYNAGLSPGDALQMMEQVSAKNLEQFAEQVQHVIDDRVSVILPKIVDELTERGTLGSIADPGMQYAALTVQRDYVRTGDEDLAETLVQLLADRSQSASRSRMQVVLDESLQVVARLTQEQMNTLSLVLLIRRPRPTISIRNHHNFIEHLRQQIMPWFPVRADDLDIQHLAYTGCTSIAAGDCTLASSFWQVWPGLWQKGFAEEQVPNELQEHLEDRLLFRPSLHDPSKLQVNAMTPQISRALAAGQKISGDALAGLFETSRLSDQEIDEFVRRNLPEWGEYMYSWDGTQLKNMELTPVGIAIAHANARRRLGSAVIEKLSAYGV